MDNNLFNFDFVKAKTGKVLSKTEKNIQYVFNLVISRTFQFFVIGCVLILALAIIKALLFFLIS